MNNPNSSGEGDGHESDQPEVSVGGESDIQKELPNETGESIYIRAQIEGPGREVLDRLTQSPEETHEFEGLGKVVEDMATVLQTIEHLDGGIRSKVARRADLQLSDEGVRHLLEVLREYRLLELEGNTWHLGPVVDEPGDRRDA